MWRICQPKRDNATRPRSYCEILDVTSPNGRSMRGNIFLWKFYGQPREKENLEFPEYSLPFRGKKVLRRIIHYQLSVILRLFQC